MAYVVVHDDHPLFLSEEYDYFSDVGSDDLYYGNDPTVSSGDNIATVSAGATLSRTVGSWVISAGTTVLIQSAVARGVEAKETDLSSHEAQTAANGVHGLAQAANIAAASESHSSLQNEKQVIHVTATGGTFTVTGTEGQSVAIDFDATASALRTAVGACVVGGVTNIVVNTGAPDYEIEFVSGLAATDMAMLELGVGSLTGGTATIEETQKGGSAGLADLDALGATVNEIIAALEGAGLSTVTPG